VFKRFKVKRIRKLLGYAYILVREGYFIEYKARKSTTKVKKIASEVKSGVLVFIGMSFFISIFLAVGLGLMAITTTLPEILAATTLSLSAICFLFTFIFVSLYSWFLQEYKLLEPLRLLPLNEEDISLIVLLYSLFYVLPVMFSPIMFLLVVMIRYVEPLALAHVLLGPYSTIILAVGLAYLLANFLISYGKVSGRVLRARISRIISVMIFVITMFIFQISQRMIWHLTNLLKQLVKTPIIELLWFLYPVSIVEGIRTSFDNPYKSLQLLLIQVAYTLIFFILYMKSFNRYYMRVSVPVILVLKCETPPIKAPSKLTMNYLIATIIKDFKIITREPRVASLVFMPLYSTISFLLSLFSSKMYTNPMFCNILSIIYASILTLSIPLVPFQLIISEGRSLWFSLHLLGKKGLLKGKILFTVITCAIYATIVALIMSVVFKSITPLVLAIEAMLISYTISCIVAKMVAPKLIPTLKAMPRFSMIEALMVIIVSLLIAGIPLGTYGLTLVFRAELEGLIISFIICIIETGIAYSLVERISESPL